MRTAIDKYKTYKYEMSMLSSQRDPSESICNEQDQREIMEEIEVINQTELSPFKTEST